MSNGLFQPLQVLVIIGIALIVFGPKRIPELGSALGKAIREFKKATRETENKLDNPTTRPKEEVPKG
jgi:sec-independent protein translocase protein TatA